MIKHQLSQKLNYQPREWHQVQLKALKILMYTSRITEITKNGLNSQNEWIE